jgi:hypothetical protein
LPSESARRDRDVGAVSARIAAFALATIFALSIAYDLLRMPVQLHDTLGEIVEAQQSPSVWASFIGTFGPGGYLRPLRITQSKALFDLADGRYHLVYRGFHALLIVLLFVLFTTALRVRTGIELAAAAFALTVLMGLHTFLGTVREAFPIAHYLEIVVLCLAALNVAQSRGGWWADAAAALIFVVAALTLESGVLVWVVIVAGWIVGLRGVSARGVIAVTALLAGYFYLRFVYLSGGLPTLIDRSSGFLLQRLEPEELQRRFGADPTWFYAYNVVVSVLSVLLSEPRDGVFRAVAAWRDGEILPRTYLAVGSSLATTLLVMWVSAACLRARAWPGSPTRTPARWGGCSHEADRLLPIFAAVLLGNAAVSFAYTKDEIVTVAGAFYALAAFAAARHLLERVHGSQRLVPAVLTSVLLFSLGCAWAVRSAGVHHVLRLQAFSQRNDWADVSLPDRVPRWRDPRARALIEQLRTDALKMQVVNPHVLPRWWDRLLGD